MRRRIVPAAVSATLVVAALTGCAGSGDSNAECVNPLRPGPLSNGVEVGSDGGVKITGDTGSLNAQLTTAVESEDRSRIAEPGAVVFADVTIYDAVSGSQLDRRENSPYLALPENLLPEAREKLQSSESDSLPVQYLLATALVCAAPGDTLVMTATADQAMRSQLSFNSVVAVVDVLQTFPGRVEGAARGLPSGFPAVATDESGRPGVVLPPQAAPAKITSAARIVGDGEKITAKDSPIGNVLTVSWKGAVVTNTWDTNLVIFGTEDQPNTDYGFRDQLDGYPIGSQVVILDPNDGDPVVHVVDIVAAM